ncbi:hypothetical protein C3L33_07776, partial [Rhododendron williamsianum]
MSEEDLHTCLLLLHFLHLHLFTFWLILSAFRNRGLSIRTSRACCVKSEVPSCYLDDKASNGDSCLAISEGYMSLKRFYRASHGSLRPFVGRCSFSSQADSESSTQEEDDLEDGFSELETPANADVVKEKQVDEVNEDELISEPELSEDEDDAEGPQNELELSDIEADIAEKRSAQMGASSALFDAIMRAPGLSVQSALDNWVEGGNELTRSKYPWPCLIFESVKCTGGLCRYLTQLLYYFIYVNYVSYNYKYPGLCI